MRQGIIKLPQVHHQPCFKAKEGKGKQWIPDIAEVRCNLSELGEIEIIRIGSRYSKIHQIWKELMNRYHYLGSGCLCGHQMRYLIKSKDYGYPGGLAFSSAAWRLQERDQWIGWDDSARKSNLNKVVCNSRFLIVPQVRVKNLASNWIHVGSTKGRGRQDRRNRYEESVKDIYLYPLEQGFREELCGGANRIKVKKKAPADWAEEEFSGAEPGDKRRVNRLITIARDFYGRPNGNIPQACGSRAKTKAAYRFLEHPENTMENIHKSHYEATLSRIKREKVVLAVQDTTTLNYSAHPATENPGLIGYKEEGVTGLIVHDTMAFNVEGTPLGIIDVQSWARDPAGFGKKHKRKQYAIEQKESYKWLKSFKATEEAQRHCGRTTLVSAGDREADIYEFFHLALNKPKGPKLLVRAEHNRLLADGQGKLYEHISSQELAGVQIVHVPRKKKQSAREAKLEIRFAKVKLKPPQDKKEFGELSVYAIVAEEIDVPEGVEGLRWILLSTCEVKTFEQAIEKLQWYCLRWGIEIYHRTLRQCKQIKVAILSNRCYTLCHEQISRIEGKI
ncbi:MAG: hypothetical protein IEMM0007_2009 [bacterium]|nr:MAG: hypothetical protein IEMM0007_2009 [bacterium]